MRQSSKRKHSFKPKRAENGYDFVPRQNGLPSVGTVLVERAKDFLCFGAAIQVGVAFSPDLFRSCVRVGSPVYTWTAADRGEFAVIHE